MEIYEVEQQNASPPPQQKPAPRKVVGKYIQKIEDIPAEVREYAVNRLSPTDTNGNRLLDGNGQPVTANIATAKENGSYYGPVVLNNDKYLVQAVGKDRLYAVVHSKENIKLVGAVLANLDDKKKMGGFVIQVHYSGDQAKAFPYTDKSRSAPDKPLDAPAKAPEPLKDAVTRDSIMTLAAEYAKQNIKNANQREAFLKHFGNVTQEAFQQEAKPKTVQQPQQAKADTSIER